MKCMPTYSLSLMVKSQTTTKAGMTSSRLTRYSVYQIGWLSRALLKRWNMKRCGRVNKLEDFKEYTGKEIVLAWDKKSGYYFTEFRLIQNLNETKIVAKEK